MSQSIKENLVLEDLYQRDGFVIVPLYEEKEFQTIEHFAKDWLYHLLEPWTKGDREKFPLEKYHLWFKDRQVEHGPTFRAANRYTNPPVDIEQIILNDRVKKVLSAIGVERFQARDEGLGWLGFRFIRPGAQDGYPFSKKAWGHAVGSVSFWIPVLGLTARETLTLVPGSHRRDYAKFLPDQQKFTATEFRLDMEKLPEDFQTFQPDLKRGEAIIYDHQTLHTEDVLDSPVTRLNLEFRINPQ